VLYRTVREEHAGIFNVTGEGVLLLSQAIRICGKLPLPVPHPLTAQFAAAMRRLRLVDFPSDQLQLLVFGRVADGARLEHEFDFRPRYTTRQALEDFVQSRRFRRFVTPERAEGWER